MVQCTAKSKRTGKRCKAKAMRGKRVCYHHGGRTPSGFAFPHHKTGRHSKDLPARLLARYETAISDPDLLELRDEIAVTDARLSDVLTRVDRGESGQMWRELKTRWDAHLNARAEGDMEAERATLDEMGNLIQRGMADDAAWGEAMRLIDQRRRLVESERKRRVELQQVLTADQAMVMVTTLIDAVRRNVKDQKTLSAISNDIGFLLNAHAGAGDR